MTRAERIQRRRALQAQRQARQTQLAQSRAASRRIRRQRRNITAWTVKGATEFTSDPVLSNPVAVVELFQRFAPAACLQLIAATTPDRYRGQPGARRMEGSWALAFFAHIMTGNPDWQNWYHDWQDSRLWEVCGFERTPAWMTVYFRFCELEQPRYVAAFTQAANRFVRIAERNEPRALRHFHTDGTAAHSHAKLEHACPSEDYCETRDGRATKQIERASDENVSVDRQARSAEPEPTDPRGEPALDTDGESTRVIYLSDEEAQALGLPDWRRSLYLKFGRRGHIYRCRDKHAGVRAYTASNGRRRTKKAWVGGYFLPAMCDFFWAPVAVHFIEARVQEHLGWPDLYRKLLTALNDDPDAPDHVPTSVVADRAFTNATFIGFNTANGVASITPERQLPGGRDWAGLRDPAGRWDEHGPRCKYCGGPSAPARGAGEGFAINGSGDPRLTYRCALGWTQDCRDKLQTISVTREVRALLPIGRRERVFHDLLAAHRSFEGVFDAWRDRYAVSGTSNATRSKRRLSIQAQELRAAAALLAEWFRICLRMGYVGNYARRNPHEPRERQEGEFGLRKLRRYRTRHELDMPMGPRAAQLMNCPPAPPGNGPPAAASSP